MCGGGRYDGLAEDIGGAATPGVGFGSGIERIVLGMKEQGLEPPTLQPLPVLVSHFGGETKRAAVELTFRLRDAGIGTRLAFARKSRSMKSQMREADRHAARFVVIVGGDELARGDVTVKALERGEQIAVPAASLVAWLQEQLA
jgi:histidyl-tRNA synthetase